MRQLVLTATRQCNCRCSYCPTDKVEGALSVSDAEQAVELLAKRYGGGEVQITGGEPLLVPQVVRAALVVAERRPEIRRVQLCTNGLLLTPRWVQELSELGKVRLVVSVDGRPADHRQERVAVGSDGDSYGWLPPLIATLRRWRRLVVTQTIAPSTAARASGNFDHLLSMGLSRFKFLPVYYRRWQPAELEELRRSFDAMEATIRGRWERGEPLYLQNLFTWAPTPLYNAGLVVDTDGTLLASNAALATACRGLRDETRVGTLTEPPSWEAVQSKAADVPRLLEQALPAEVWQSTRAVDAALTSLCRALYPHFAAHRERRRGAR